MIEDYIKENPFFLAPMAGVTDKPFRSFMKNLDCGVITTELISARALLESNPKTRQLMERHKGTGPWGVQIFGHDPETLSQGAKEAEQTGPDFIDLNLGCPVNKIVKKGAGSALLKDLKTLGKILKKLRDSVSLPLSLKVRTGWNNNHRNALEVSYMAFNEGFSWVTIHGRSRAQGYSGAADWSYIKQVASQSKLPVIGNGDLNSAEQAVKALKSSHCRGVMIGRGCLSNPWIFKECLYQFKGIQFIPESLKELIEKLSLELESFYEDRIFLIQLKKFTAWFSTGLPNSALFRQKLFQLKEKSAIFDLISAFFETMEMSFFEKKHEPFLKHGHG